MDLFLLVLFWLVVMSLAFAVGASLRVWLLNITLNRLDRRMTLNKSTEGREQGEKMANSLHYWETALEIAIILTFLEGTVLVFAHKFYGWPWN